MDNLELGASLPKEEEFALGNMGLESMANAIYFPKRFSEYFDRFVLFKGSIKEKINFTNNLDWLLKKLTLKNDGKRLLLKSPFNTGRIKMLLQLYPDAKFIHIHRHPFSVFSSNEKLYESVIPQVAFHHIGNEEMEEHIIYTYKATMENYFKEKETLNKNQLYEMSYKELISDPVNSLKNVYAQLELNNFESAFTHFEKEIKNYEDYKPNIHQADEVKKARINKEWAFAFAKLNYESDNIL